MPTGFLRDLGDLECLENTVGSHMSFTPSTYIAQLITGNQFQIFRLPL